MAEQQPRDPKQRPAPPAQPTFAQLLLEMPQDDGEFERLPVKPRDVTFE